MTGLKLFTDVDAHNVAASQSLRFPKNTVALATVKPAGSVIYNTTDSAPYFSDGTAWLPLVSPVPSATFKGGLITTTRVLTAADNGTTFRVVSTNAFYLILLPPTAAGLNLRFVLTSTAQTNHVTIQTAAGNHLYGTIVEGTPEVDQIDNVNAVTFDSSAENGDNIDFWGADSTHWMVRATSSGTNGIISGFPP
uniref:Uncharacterized protein n=1 Tax=Marseillevirus LCMAC103 TaxID=2506604 RepID=A0A481YW87_9VIRU|nr:MAG: hypothetical protein LCMAC103_01720 [Marseillevirus LCMAC103]